MQEFLSAVRSACSPNLWSQGVELARRLAVTGVSDEDGEVVCRVKVPQRAAPFTVRLYAEDAEWDCDCNSRADCCEHVAAAAIAVNKARAAGQGLPEGRSQGAQLVHCFTRHRGFLSLERVIRMADGTQRPLRSTVASAIAMQSEGLELSPSQQDLAVDRMLGQRLGGPLHAELGAQVIKLLGGARNVEFEGKPMYVSTEILRPLATITEQGHAYQVVLTADPRVDEVVAPGVGRVGETIQLLHGTAAAGDSWELLPSDKVYADAQIATLVTEVLPELSKHFTLEVKTDKLPKLDRSLRPRERLRVEQAGETLSVLAEVVYGEPACCRVDAGRLVYLQGNLPVRNTGAEQNVAERVKSRLGLTIGRRLTLSGAQATELAIRLDRFDGEVVGRKRSSFILSADLQPQLSPTTPQGSVVPNLRFQARTTDGTQLEADAAAVLRAWQKGEPLVALLDGGWAPLPNDWLQRFGPVLERVLTARDTQGQVPTHVKPALVELYAALNTPPPADLEPLRQLLYEPQALAAPQLPGDLKATLRPYQEEGVRWLSLLQRAQLGATLADDMGLGKTLQVICTLKGHALVIAPTSLVFNWADELSKFRPELSVNIYHGKSRTLEPGADVTLTSYALLRLDLTALQAETWDMIVLDEAQAIKNPESQVAQAAYTLRAPFRVTVTGTPVENRLEELWSQFHFTNPGLLGGREAFRKRYADPTQTDSKEALVSLRRTIAPFVLRRDKRTVAKDLPPRSDIVLRCDLDDQERGLYDALLNATRDEIVSELKAGGNVMKALEALLRLRQAACHSALVPGQTAQTSSKVEVLCAALEEAIADRHKALVFSQWTSLLDLIEPHLESRGIQFGRLDGATRDRAGVVNTFQSANGGPDVLLLSLKAGGVGLNLTAADHVFLMDLWWNPAVEQQAADRAHRLGQDNPVFVHRIVARNTVEEKILKLQETKRAVADAVLADADQVSGLSRHDLLDLLQ